MQNPSERRSSAWLPVLVGAGLLLTSCTGGGGAALPLPTDGGGGTGDARSSTRSDLQPMGEPSPVVPESEITPDRVTPERLLRSIVDGVAREDASFLCRIVHKYVDTPELTKLDQAWAWRHFLMKAPRAKWTNLADILDTGGLEIEEQGGELALATFGAGPSVERGEIRMVKISGEWYLEVAE